MSQRPILTKKANKFRKAMRQTPLAYINLVEWLMDRGHAQTKGEARAIILARRVRSESHILGVQKVTRLKKLTAVENLAGRESQTEEVDEVEPFVTAKYRPTLYVKAA